MLEVWATERAVGVRAVAARTAPRVQIKPDREISEAAGTRDHQGVLAWTEPYRYADAHELAAAERPLLACLDQVTDPRNLGAVIRSAEGAGATGVVVPAHGSAMVTPAVARASAGAVEHLPVAVVPNLARYLNEIKRGDLWIYAAAADAEQDLWQADLTGGLALVFGAEGKGVRPLVRRACDATISIPARRAASSRSTSASPRRCSSTRRGGGAMAEPTLYLFDGHNLLHAGGYADQRELTDTLASFVALRGARGFLVWDGVGVDAEVGPLSVRFAPHADAVLERLAAEHRDDRGRLPRLLRLRGPRHLGAGGAEALVPHLRRRPAAAAPPGVARLPARRQPRRRDARAARAAAPRRGVATPGERERRCANAPTATTTRSMTTLCVYFCAADVSPTRG